MSDLDCGEGADVTKVFDVKFPRATALADVAAERQRQIEQEGWDAQHDDDHAAGELALAGAAYVAHDQFPSHAHDIWPWSRMWWKPTTRRRDLVKAAALIVAEIERMDRAENNGAK